MNPFIDGLLRRAAGESPAANSLLIRSPSPPEPAMPTGDVAAAIEPIIERPETDSVVGTTIPAISPQAAPAAKASSLIAPAVVARSPESAVPVVTPVAATPAAATAISSPVPATSAERPAAPIVPMNVLKPVEPTRATPEAPAADVAPLDDTAFSFQPIYKAAAALRHAEPPARVLETARATFPAIDAGEARDIPSHAPASPLHSFKSESTADEGRFDARAEPTDETRTTADPPRAAIAIAAVTPASMEKAPRDSAQAVHESAAREPGIMPERRHLEIRIGSIEVRVPPRPQAVEPARTETAPAANADGFGEYQARRAYDGWNDW